MRVSFFDLEDARAAVTQVALPEETWQAPSSAEGFAAWLLEHRDGITLTAADGSVSAELREALQEYQQSAGVTEQAPAH